MKKFYFDYEVTLKFTGGVEAYSEEDAKEEVIASMEGEIIESVSKDEVVVLQQKHQKNEGA